MYEDEQVVESVQEQAVQSHSLTSENTSLRISPDRCALLLSGEFAHDLLKELKEHLILEIKKLGCSSEALIAEALGLVERYFEETGDGTACPTVVVNNLVLLTGTPPTEPEDARLEWAQDFFQQGFEVDPESGTVDYRKRSAHLSVTEGQLLATLYPARPGTAGTDVFGKPIPPRKPRTIRLRASSNVRYDETEGCYYATAAGRIRYANGVVAVDNVFAIADSVGLATGNIKHPGAVIVGQNIEAGSKVEASGDVEVTGYVEDAEIIVGGNLFVKGGITGGGGGFIRVAGDVRAKFVQNADIEAHGDVVVEREIDQSRVRSRGAVSVIRGRIVGGSVTALRGIVADQIGSDASIVTNVATGEDFLLEAKLAALESQREEHLRMKEQIDAKLEPFERAPRIPEHVKAAIVKLRGQSEEHKKCAVAIEEEMDGLRAEFHEARKLEMMVRRHVAPDVVFQLAGLTLRSKESFPGPIKVGIRDGDIHFMETRLEK